jgi:sialate O-acetylesterase
MFNDNMVLQYNVDTNTIYGSATGNSVKISVYGLTVETKIVANHFSTKLPKITKPGGPHSILVEELPSGKTITLKNILFGDVFFCSGQSKEKI